MRHAWSLMVLAGCFQPPELDTIPWEAPILTGDDGPVERCAPEREDRVACTVDGDTLDLGTCGADIGERLRLLGIDAPETAKDTTPAECFANEAAAELDRLLSGADVLLSFDRDCTGVFDRTLAYVWLPRDRAEVRMRRQDLDDTLEILGLADDPEAPVMINAYLLVTGYARRFDEAWVEALYWENELVAAERLAELRQNGLWATCP